RRKAGIGSAKNPGAFAGGGNGPRLRRRRPRAAGEIRADFEHRNAAMARGLGVGGSETHVALLYREPFTRRRLPCCSMKRVTSASATRRLARVFRCSLLLAGD